MVQTCEAMTCDEQRHVCLSEPAPADPDPDPDPDPRRPTGPSAGEWNAAANKGSVAG